MAKPPSTGTTVTAAEVAISSAVIPAAPSAPESAIEKQAACAAPISSSGLVPFSSPKRLAKL